MPLYSSTLQSLRKVFLQAFVVHDIAEPLVSFDDWTDVDKVREVMEAQRLEVVGVRQAGRVKGYLERKQLGTGTCGRYVQPFDERQVILDSSTLAELVPRLKEQRRLFVSILGRVGAIVSRSDLQKPPVRMWLFGMVTLIEIRFRRLIDQQYPEGQWREFLSEGRVQKAELLLAERQRRQQELNLLDCLQLSDKAQIVARSAELRSMTRFASRRQVEEAGKMLEKLRNNLAHSQDIIAHDWDTIVSLSEQLDAVLEGATSHTASPRRSIRADEPEFGQ